MGLIIELIGGRGSGKTTLIKRIKKYYVDCQSIEGFRKIDNDYDIHTVEGFVKNEREYIRRSIKECQMAASDNMTIITSGPREILFYLEYNANRYYPSESVLEIMKADINGLTKVFSPNVIYLFASGDKLRENIKNDKNKCRENVDFWIEFSYYVNERMKIENNTYRIDINNLTTDEVATIAFQHIAELRKGKYD